MYLSLIYPGKKYERIINRIKYLSCQRFDISNAHYYKYTIIGALLKDSVPLEEIFNIPFSIITIIIIIMTCAK